VIKGGEAYPIFSPVVISAAGLFNTFRHLLPIETARKSYFFGLCDQLEPGLAAMSVFVGLNASNEELNLPKTNTWAFVDPEACFDFQESYANKSIEEVLSGGSPPPLLFISFPSTKDPEWDLRHPAGKSTAAIITLASWKWFQDFKDTNSGRRGDKYEEIKANLGDAMLERTLELFPQLKNNVDLVDIGTPVTNNYYLRAQKGEIYGLDHGLGRFGDPWTVARMRPATDVPGLFLAGQDVLTCGVTGAAFSGLIASCAVLNRNVAADLENLHDRLNGKKME